MKIIYNKKDKKKLEIINQLKNSKRIFDLIIDVDIGLTEKLEILEEAMLKIVKNKENYSMILLIKEKIYLNQKYILLSIEDVRTIDINLGIKNVIKSMIDLEDKVNTKKFRSLAIENTDAMGKK